MGLLKILEINNIELRPDVRDAVAASPDMYNAMQQNLYKPQLIHGVKWAQDNISAEDDKVMLMGWASLGTRILGGPILGMFVLTEKKLCFARDDGSANVSGDDSIQVYDIADISNVKSSGMLALRKIIFEVGGKERKWERIHKDNMKKIVGQLTKEA